MRASRFSMEAMLDAPDTTEARPGLRLRIVAIAMVGLFALLGLRLWALQVLQAPAAAQAVVANQIRSVPVTPTRGLILDRNGNPLVGNVVTEQITLSRVAAQHNPAVIGRLAALVGKTPAADRGRPRQPAVQPVQAGADHERRPAGRHRLHQGAPGGVPGGQLDPDHPAHLPPEPAARPGPGVVPGGPGPRLRRDHQLGRAEVPGVPGVPGRRRLRAGRDSSTSTRRPCTGPPDTSCSRSTPRARWPGC